MKKEFIKKIFQDKVNIYNKKIEKNFWISHNEKKNDLLFNFYENITKFLNLYNKVNENTNYWKNIYEPWINYFIIVYLYRRSLFDLEFNNNFSKNKFFKDELLVNTFYDHIDFMNNTNNFEFNYNFLNNIKYYNTKKNDKYFDKITLINKNHSLSKNIKTKLFFIKYFKKIIINIIEKTYFTLLPKNYALFLFPNRFDIKSIIKIIFKTRFRVFFEFSSNDIKNYKYDIKLRESFFKFLSKNNNNVKYDALFTYLFCIYVPMSKLENQQIYTKNPKNNIFIKKPPTLVFSSSAHIENELRINLLARLNKEKINIQIIQHGNNYRIIDKNFHTGIESEYSYGKLLTWGWTNSKKEKIMSSPRLNTTYLEVKKIRSFKENRILFVSFPIKKYSLPRSFLYLPRMEINLLYNLINLYEGLNTNLKSIFYFRNYPYINYSETLTNDDLSNHISDLKFDNDIKYKSIKKSSVIIFNGLSTMMLEILNLNKPFFLLFDFDDYFIDKKLIKIFKKLEKVKILHKNSESLLLTLNSLNIDKINKVYFSKDRLILYKYFKKYFAKIHVNHSIIWSEYINKILNKE